jgi:Tol biopolymer transport system component/DNA-binding winged helix-turn-helix (wHTH) protein
VVENGRHLRIVRFGTFEVDVQSGELRKSGLKLKLSGQPFQVLAILLERPGEVVTREELQKRLWPDTFVDVDHNLNTAINKIREALGDSAENPRFVETLPRRGYRFVAPVEGAGVGEMPVEVLNGGVPKKASQRPWTFRLAILLGASVLLIGMGFFVYERRHVSGPPKQRILTRVTFDDGLQIGVTWSPDGRYIAYSSDRAGKFDIWVQQLSGGDPVQITKGHGNNWQPDWSPDGKYIAYRSEGGDGGLFIIPALGGQGLEEKISSFGYCPLWSPDGTQILFQSNFIGLGALNRLYLVDTNRRTPRELFVGDASYYALFKDLDVFSVAWHPDGKRITLWAWSTRPEPNFWTVPIEGGSAVKTKIPSEIVKQLAEVSAGPDLPEANNEWKFAWNSAGTAIYFARKYRGASNIWRMTVEPQTLQVVALERLTTGSDLDADLSLSRDGRNLAFTAKFSLVRAWLFPFDGNHGKLSGPGQAVTSVGIDSWLVALSPDGKRLAFGGGRAGRYKLWEKFIDHGPESPVIAEEFHVRSMPQWSPDGTQLAYGFTDPANGQSQIMKWSSDDRSEIPVTLPGPANWNVNQWSPDGKSLLATIFRNNERQEIWQIPLDESPACKCPPRILISNPGLDLYQANFSKDGHWISFLAIRERLGGKELTVYVIPSAGGKWIPITDGKYWDDKPRWSPDGKTIYFVSNRGGFFNVWGQHFDPDRGQTLGEAFPVTSFNRPNLMVPNDIQNVELSLGRDRLAITAEQASGSIWILDNLDRQAAVSTPD